MHVVRFRHGYRHTAFHTAGLGVAFLVEGFDFLAGLLPMLAFLAFRLAFGLPDFIGALADSLVDVHVTTSWSRAREREPLSSGKGAAAEVPAGRRARMAKTRSEEHTYELQSLMSNSYAV